MERTEVFDMMGDLKLYGMRSAYDETLSTAIKRKHEAQRFVGDLLKAEISKHDVPFDRSRFFLFRTGFLRLPGVLVEHLLPLIVVIPARALERYEAQQQRVTADAKAAGDPLQPVVASFAQAGATDGIDGHCHIDRFYWPVLTRGQGSVSIKSTG
jgi:hypothetical protein